MTWAYSKRLNPFKVDSSKGCKIESTEHYIKSCYCGGWKEGKCFDLLSKDDQEKIRSEFKKVVTSEIPF